MVYLINKNDLGFDSQFCHKIIQYRNKFIADNSLPETTFTNLFPSSHLPINFINNINHEIFDKMNTTIINTISEKYSIDKKNLNLNVSFYVENSYKINKKYKDYYDYYDYGFLILLNENTYYSGGEICIDDKEIDISDNILFFNKNEKFNIRDILIGNQQKIIGYFNLNYVHDNSNSLKYFLNNKLNLTEKKTNLFYINNLLSNEDCNDCHSSLFIDQIKQSDIKIIKENDNLQYCVIDDSIYVHIIQILHNNVVLKKKVIDILNRYNIQIKHLLPLKLLFIKNFTNVSYFNPLIGNEYSKYLNLQTEIKFTILLFLNEVDGTIYFPNQDICYSIKMGDGIIIPNSFLYSYYFKINKHEPVYCIQYSFY